MSQELARVEAVPAERGAILATPDRLYGYRWLSYEGAEALVRAAHRLGFGDDSDGIGRGWYAVVDAVVAGCLPDLLSEAIEEQEAQA